MALDYFELVHKLETEPLTIEELGLVGQVEKFIDDAISAKFDGVCEIAIDLDIADFTMDTTKSYRLGLSSTRRKIMVKELKRRFNDAGWNTDERYDMHYNEFVLNGKLKK